MATCSFTVSARSEETARTDVLRMRARIQGKDTMAALVTTPFDRTATARDVLRGVDLHQRRYLVTGGASGIGLETVRALVSAGADVVVGVRDVRAATAQLAGIGDPDSGGTVEARPLDLADLASVRAFADSWDGQLHGLVANAGIMAYPTRELTAAGWELQLATNHLGHFALIEGLQRALFDTEGARVVTVSSGAHLLGGIDLDDLHFERRPYDRWAAYAQSKTADVLLAVGVAERWAAHGVTANSLAPGTITTPLSRYIDDETLRAMGVMDEHGNRLEDETFKTTEQGAATSVLLAASPLLEGVTGTYFEDNQESPRVAGGGDQHGVAEYALDRDDADNLWSVARAALD